MKGATYLGMCILAGAVLIAASILVVGRYGIGHVSTGTRGSSSTASTSGRARVSCARR